MTRFIFYSAAGAAVGLTLLASWVLFGNATLVEGMAGAVLDMATVDRWTLALGLGLAAASTGLVSLFLASRGRGDTGAI